jgi:hypothetical protein
MMATYFVFTLYIYILSVVVLQYALVLGVVLSIILSVGLQFASRLFTKDASVLHLISVGIPVSSLPFFCQQK